jgi:hypothetical protein
MGNNRLWRPSRRKETASSTAPPSVSFWRALAAESLTDRQVRGRAPPTIQFCRFALHGFLEWADRDGPPPAEFPARDLRAFLASVQGQGTLPGNGHLNGRGHPLKPRTIHSYARSS